MSEKRVVEIPSFKLRDQTWEEFILDDKDMNGILDDDVLTILSVPLPQLIAFHAVLPLIRFCLSQNCMLKCQCSDGARAILRDLIVNELKEDRIPEKVAEYFTDWVFGEIIITFTF